MASQSLGSSPSSNQRPSYGSDSDPPSTRANVSLRVELQVSSCKAANGSRNDSAPEKKKLRIAVRVAAVAAAVADGVAGEDIPRELEFQRLGLVRLALAILCSYTRDSGGAVAHLALPTAARRFRTQCPNNKPTIESSKMNEESRARAASPASMEYGRAWK